MHVLVNSQAARGVAMAKSAEGRRVAMAALFPSSLDVVEKICASLHDPPAKICQIANVNTHSQVHQLLVVSVGRFSIVVTVLYYCF